MWVAKRSDRRPRPRPQRLMLARRLGEAAECPPPVRLYPRAVAVMVLPVPLRRQQAGPPPDAQAMAPYRLASVTQRRCRRPQSSFLCGSGPKSVLGWPNGRTAPQVWRLLPHPHLARRPRPSRVQRSHPQARRRSSVRERTAGPLHLRRPRQTGKSFPPRLCYALVAAMRCLPALLAARSRWI